MDRSLGLKSKHCHIHRFEIRRRNNINAARYQKQDHYDSFSMRFPQTEPKSAAKKGNEDATGVGFFSITPNLV